MHAPKLMHNGSHMQWSPIFALASCMYAVQGGNVIVGTPGRLQHTMLSVDKFNVKRLELLILDEADRLLDMGTRCRCPAAHIYSRCVCVCLCITGCEYSWDLMLL